MRPTTACILPLFLPLWYLFLLFFFRLQRMIQVFRKNALKLNTSQIGKTHLVLIEGYSRRSKAHFQGRNDQNVRVILAEDGPVPYRNGTGARYLKAGDYVAAQVNTANSQVLKAIPLYLTSIQEFYSDDFRHMALQIWNNWYNCQKCCLRNVASLRDKNLPQCETHQKL